MVRRLGSGDIGNVYLCHLPRGQTQTHDDDDECVLLAMKVVDMEAVAFKNKLEKNILCMMDHPFLPTLYSHFSSTFVPAVTCSPLAFVSLPPASPFPPPSTSLFLYL